ncbi:MAG: hypothetical protein ACYSU0_04195 [Planctomycetota bacterium]
MVALARIVHHVVDGVPEEVEHPVDGLPVVLEDALGLAAALGRA